MTLSELKRFLSITVSTKDTVLSDILDDAQGEADRGTNRSLAYASYSLLTHDGSGTDVLYLAQHPVYEVTALKVFNGSVYEDLLSAGDTIADNVLILKGGKIKLLNGYTFTKGCDNIQVSFTAGYKAADDWQASYSYVAGNLAIYNGTLYECATANSDAVFTVGKWTALTVESFPADLDKAIKYNATLLYFESPASEKNLFAKTSENLGGNSSSGSGYDFKSMREYYEKTYEYYRKPNV